MPETKKKRLCNSKSNMSHIEFLCFFNVSYVTHTHPEMRLRGGNSPMEGYVEITHAGVWGHVCDADWGEDEASVVCRELGYFRGFPALNRVFNTRPTRFWLNSLTCDGTEGRLTDCQRGPWGRYECPWGATASVACGEWLTVGAGVGSG